LGVAGGKEDMRRDWSRGKDAWNLWLDWMAMVVKEQLAGAGVLGLLVRPLSRCHARGGDAAGGR